MKTVITYGTFDLFHSGHKRLLERAKKLGDRLIVGVTSDFYDQQRGKLNVYQSCAKRIENVKQTGLADQIIVEEEEGQKISDIQQYNVDIFAIGSDWLGKFDYLKEYCDVIYLPRTQGISSTELRLKQNKIIRIGIVGTGRISSRFVRESKYVSGLELEAVYARNIDKAKAFAETNEIPKAFSDYIEFLENVDAVYIAVPHHVHYDYSRVALNNKKHVLCEKPLTLNANQATELFAIAKANNCILMEAVKTAYAPAFDRLVSITKSGIIGDIKAIDATFTKLITDKTLREYDYNQCGGAFSELGTYPLLIIAKLLGVTPSHVSFLTEIDKETGVDVFTRANLIYRKAICSATVGIGVKKEGDLCIAGTKGYIYVPAPWWKTEYFEIRFEDLRLTRKYFFKFDEDGLRYELASFIRAINGINKNKYMLNERDSVFFAQIMENFKKGTNVTNL